MTLHETTQPKVEANRIDSTMVLNFIVRAKATCRGMVPCHHMVGIYLVGKVVSKLLKDAAPAIVEQQHPKVAQVISAPQRVTVARASRDVTPLLI